MYFFMISLFFRNLSHFFSGHRTTRCFHHAVCFFFVFFLAKPGNNTGEIGIIYILSKCNFCLLIRMIQLKKYNIFFIVLCELLTAYTCPVSHSQRLMLHYTMREGLVLHSWLHTNRGITLISGFQFRPSIYRRGDGRYYIISGDGEGTSRREPWRGRGFVRHFVKEIVILCHIEIDSFFLWGLF